MKILFLLINALGFWLLAEPAHAGFLAAIPAFLTALGSTAIGKIVLGAIAMAAQSLLQKALAPKQKARTGVKLDVETGDDRPVSAVLGYYAAPGRRKYAGTWGSSNRHFVDVIEIASLPSAGLRGMWIDDERCTILWDEPDEDGRGYPIKEFRTDEGKDFAWIIFHDGTQTTADAYLVEHFGDHDKRPWTSAMVGRGITYAVMTYRFAEKYWSGVPACIFEPFSIPLYDIRKDSTAGGNGSHRWDNPATWEPSVNPVVMNYNIIRGIFYKGEWFYGGRNVAPHRLPASNWIAGANEAGRLLVIPGQDTEPQFRAGIEISGDIEPLELVDDLRAAANARIAEVGGIFKIQVGAFGAPVLAITDADIIITKGQSFEPFPRIEETVNGINATYPNPDEKWKSKDAPPLYDADLEAEDGDRRLTADVQFPAVPFARQTQRLMRAMLNEERRFRVHQFYLPPEAWVLEPGDLITWTSARNRYANKRFLVLDIEGELTMNQLVTLKEVDPSDYDPDAAAVLPTPSGWIGRIEEPVQVMQGWTAEAETILDADGHTRRPAIRVRCATNLDDVRAVHVMVRLKASGAVVFDSDAQRYDPASASWLLSGAWCLPATDFEVAGRLIPLSTRDTSWSAWLTVRTANILISALDIFDNAITSGKIADAAISADKIAAEAVTGVKLANEAVTTAKLAVAAVNAEVLASGAVIASKLADAAVTLSKIQDGAVIASKIADGAIERDKLAAAAVDATKFAASVKPVEIVDALPTSGNVEGRQAYLKADGKVYRYSNGAWTAAVAAVDVSGQILATQIADAAITAQKLAAAAIDATKFAASVKPVEIVDALPTSGNAEGRQAYLKSDGKVYRYSNGAWTASVSAVDIAGQLADMQIASVSAPKLTGQIISSQIADAALTAQKFATGVRPVEKVSSLPSSGNSEGRIVYLEGDGKLYRYTSTGWTSAVPSVDISGQLTDAQIAAIAATKLTGQIVTTQIADAALTAAKFATGVRPVEIVDALPTSGNSEGRQAYLKSDGKVYRYSNGAWTSAVPSTDVSGQLTDAQIAAVSAAKLAGQIVSNQLSDQAVTSSKLAALAVDASKLADGSVGTTKIQAGAVVANNIAANAITAKQLLLADLTNVADNGWQSGDLSGWQTQLQQSFYKEGFDTPVKGSYILQSAGRDCGYSKPVEVNPGDVYYFEAWVCNLSGGYTANIIATVTRSDGTSLYPTIATTVSGAWVKISGQYVLPANAIKLAMLLQVDRAAAAGNASVYWSRPVMRRAQSSELIVDGAISASKIASGSVTTEKLQAGAVTADTIAAGAITSAKISADAITSDKIAAGAVTADELAANAVTAGKISAGAISTDKLAAGAVTASKMLIGDTSNMVDNGWSDGSIDGWSTSGRQNFYFSAGVGDANGWIYQSNGRDQAISRQFMVNPGEVYYFEAWVYNVDASRAQIMARVSSPSTVSFASVAYTDAKNSFVKLSGQYTIPAGYNYLAVDLQTERTGGQGSSTYWSKPILRRAATGELIVDGAVTATKVAAGAVTAEKIAADSITSDKIVARSIIAEDIALRTLQAENIAANSLDAQVIAANAVTADKLAANSVTAGKLAANSVTAEKIQGGSILADKLAVGTGANCLGNSDFSAGFSGWRVDKWNAGEELVEKGTSWTPDDLAFARVRTLDDGSFVNILPVNKEDNSPKRFPVIPGTRYEVSAYTAAHRCQVFVMFAWYDANGSFIGEHVGGVNNAQASGGKTLSNFFRSVLIMNAPAGAASVLPSLRKQPTFSGQGDSYMWASQVFFAEAKPNQSEASPWSSSGVTRIGNGDILTNAITSDKIMARTIVAEDIALRTLQAENIQANALTSDVIAANAITAGKIAAGAVTAGTIAASAITSDKIDANAVTAGKIAAGAVSTDQLSANAVTAAKIQAGTITGDKLAVRTISADSFIGGTITGYEISARTIGAGNIAVGAITANELAANAIIAGKIAAGAVSTDQLAANAITADKIQAGTITGDRIAVRTISADSFLAGTITGYEISARTIVATHIATGALTANEIAANAITADKLAANAVTAGKISAGAVTADAIQAGTITGDKLQAATISGDKLQANTLGAREIAANAITAKHLVLTDFSNLVPDNQMISADAWQGVGWGQWGDHTIFESYNAFRYNAGPWGSGGYAGPFLSTRFPVRASAAYRAIGQAYSNDNYNCLQRVWWYDANGAEISTVDIMNTGNRGAGGARALANIVAPSYAVTAAIGAYVQRDGTSGPVYVGGFGMFERNAAELIVDGGITTGKLAANAITAGVIDAGAVSTDKLLVGGVTYDKLGSRAAGYLGIAETGSAFSITTAFQPRLSIDVSKPAQDGLEVVASFRVRCTNLGGAISASVQYRLREYLNGTYTSDVEFGKVYFTDTTSDANDVVSAYLIHMKPAGPSGNYTYALEIKKNAAASDFIIGVGRIGVKLGTKTG